MYAGGGYREMKKSAKDKKIEKQINRNYRKTFGFNWWTDIKAYFYLMFHPRVAVDMKYDDDLRKKANLREILERSETGETRRQYWARVLGHD